MPWTGLNGGGVVARMPSGRLAALTGGGWIKGGAGRFTSAQMASRLTFKQPTLSLDQIGTILPGPN